MEIHRYPEWATLEEKDEILWYHHHHCGRSTSDTAEVISHQVQSVDINGQMVSVLQEEWQDQDKRWTSIAIPKGELNQESLKDHFSHIVEWRETERFHFGLIQD